MRLCFAFDTVAGGKVENDIRAYGVIPNAPLIEYLLQRDHSSKSLPIISLSNTSDKDRNSGCAIIYGFRLAVHPNAILSPAAAENDWFGASPRHRLFRRRIEQLASIDNLNLLIDHTWEHLSFEQVEDFVKIFLRLRFPSERLIIISSNRKLTDSTHIFRKYGTIVMGHWFWEAYVQSLMDQISVSVDDNLSTGATDRLYLSLNRNPRPHRIAMCAFLLSRGYDKISHLSFGGEKALPPAEGDVAGLANSAKRHFTDANGPVLGGDIDSLISRGPIDLDVRFSPATDSAKMATGKFESISTFYRRARISIVTETFFANSLLEVCLTEKIFKPIAFRHVFLVAASPGALFELRRLGYETFGELFDESYDEICDPKERLIKIFDIIDKLSKDWVDRGDKIFAPLQDVLTHNQNNLMKSSDRRIDDFMESLIERITERRFLPREFGTGSCDRKASASDLRDELVFASGGNGAPCLRAGFSYPEPWGVWTVEPQATIAVPIADPSNLLLLLEFQTFARDNGPPAGFSLDVQGQTVGKFSAQSGRWGEVYERKFEIPSRLIKRKQLEITLKIENGPTPAELEPGRRPIGVGLRRMRLISTAPTRQPCDLAADSKHTPAASPRQALSNDGPMKPSHSKRKPLAFQLRERD